MEVVKAPETRREKLRAEFEAKNRKADINAWYQKQIGREREDRKVRKANAVVPKDDRPLTKKLLFHPDFLEKLSEEEIEYLKPNSPVPPKTEKEKEADARAREAAKEAQRRLGKRR